MPPARCVASRARTPWAARLRRHRTGALAVHRRHGRTAGGSPLHHGHRARRRRRHAPLGHRGRSRGHGVAQTDELFDAVIWQYGTTPEGDKDPVVAGVTTAMTSAGYRDLVAMAVAAMTRPAASLRKVVLSRPVTIELDGPLAPRRGPAPPSRRRAQLHHLLHARARRHVLRGQPRVAGGAPRRPRDCSSTGGNRPAWATPRAATPMRSATWRARPRTARSTVT